MQDRIGDGDRIFSVGYEGRSIDAFVALLEREGIERVADVRDNPWSRKPGFTGSTLQTHLFDASIDYVHLGDLGAPKQIRDQADDGEAFLAAYRDHLDGQADAVEELVEQAREATTAMMCLEADPAECHRQVIAKRLRERGWTVIDVG